MTFWLAGAYVVLLLAAAWVLASAAGWRAKLALIVAAPLVGFALWQASVAPAGWPTRAKPPSSAQFMWGVIQEPDPLTQDPGAIYLWLQPAGATRPRAYRLPYTRRLHKQVQAAMDAQKHGRSTSVTHTAKGRRGRSDGQRGPLRFYPTPPVRLPAKG